MKDFILYNYFRSSTSFRVRIALHLKGIEFEYRPVNLLKGEQHSEWYRKINPQGGVPTLVHKGFHLSQSIAILEYLDEILPDKPIFPNDPALKAKIRQVVEDINSGLHPMGNLQVLQYLEQKHSYTQEMKNEWVAHWFNKSLSALEKQLAETSKSYCFGIHLTAADLVLIPALVTATRFQVDLAPYPTLRKIYDNSMQLEAFKLAAPANQPDAI